MQNQDLIERAFADAESVSKEELLPAVASALAALDSGELRVAEKQGGKWQVNEWLKKAILLSFRHSRNDTVQAGWTNFYDKVPTKYADYDSAAFKQQDARVVPGAIVRYGSFIAPKVILMPSYVNIGAYVGEGTLVDTWATVGSCAQIGKNVHLSGGAGIGGVLEPLQASPTIVEDNCFIGARSEVVEGVIVEEGAVLSMGVYVGASTPIYDRTKDEISHGRVPADAVVVPGSLPAKNGKYSQYAAIIVKYADAKTRQKVGINQLLRFNPDE